MALIDRIKFDGPPNVLVWRHPQEDISWLAQVIVNESQEAVFFKGGQVLDVLGPGTHTIKSANIPLLRDLFKIPFGGETPFAAEIYFVNKAMAVGLNWGTKTPVMLVDPKYHFTIPIRGYGQYAVHVIDSKNFVVKVAGTSYSIDAHQQIEQMLDTFVLSSLQQGLGEFVINKQISVLDVPGSMLDLSEYIASLLASRYKTFGLEFVNFVIESINYDQDDESVKRLRQAIDETARLDLMGDAVRRNPDFYRMEQQFNVLKEAAGNEGGAGNLVGATMGIGMGMGLAGPVGEIAKSAMAAASIESHCPKCNATLNAGNKFCSKCGGQAIPDFVKCPHCDFQNDAVASFCSQCGKALATVLCPKCGAKMANGMKFCGECGEKFDT